MDKQRTIQREISIKGVGLHTAKSANLVFKPAEVDSGINFVRTDLPGKPVIKACIENSATQAHSPRKTSLFSDGVELYTVEHLMAALSGLAIDNLRIEIDNLEVPGLDGSSVNFLNALSDAGIKEQEKPRQYYSLKEPIAIEEDGSALIALPSSELRISYTLNYNHPLLKAQFLELSLTPEIFRKEFAAARTFCLEEEADGLQQQGFGQGANYENTLVVGKNGVVKNTLRFPDEFVRHKVLDLLGDLYLLGVPLKAHIIALKSGHSLNLKLVRKIKEQMTRYSLGGIAAVSHLEQGTELDIEAIKGILPHRQPFLFVDRIISLEKGKRAVGIKNVSINDYFFKGHFPGKPVMPGVLILEAMAQVGGVMVLSLEENRGKLAFFMAADNIKFRKTVIPGDQLIFEVEAVKVKSKTGQVTGKAMVDGKVVAEADILFVLS